jgi:hypothetical protein
MHSEVYNKTERQNQQFTSSQKEFGVSQTRFYSAKLSDMYLRRESDQYYVYVLGKNGDPISGQSVEVKAVHKNNTQEPCTETLVTDKRGRVHLGTLNDINRITAKQTKSSGR